MHHTVVVANAVVALDDQYLVGTETRSPRRPTFTDIG